MLIKVPCRRKVIEMCILRGSEQLGNSVTRRYQHLLSHSLPPSKAEELENG